MLLGIDHLVIAVGDLDAAAAELETSLGLEAGGGGRHPAFGTQNRLVWLGDSFVELVSIAEPGLAAESWFGSLISDLVEGGLGGGLATWVVASDSLEADVSALQAFGSSLRAPAPGERRRGDGLVVRWRVSLPDRLGPSEPPFVIEHDPTSAEWTLADRAARGEQLHPIGGSVRLEVLELPTANLAATIARLARTLGLRFRPSLAGHGARDANIGPQIVRLAPTRSGTLGVAATPHALVPVRAAGAPVAIPAPGVPAPAPTIRLASPKGDDRVVTALGCRWVLRRSG